MKKNFILLASVGMLLAACGGKPASSTEGGSSAAPQGAPVKDGAISLTKNHDGKEVSFLHPKTQEYIDAMYEAEEAEELDEEQKYMMRDNACGSVTPTTYQGKPETENNDQDHFMPISLEWDYAGYTGEYVVKYATNNMLEEAKELTVTTNKAELVNLFTDTTYYWQVSTKDGAHDSQVGSFHTKGSFRMMESGLAYNVRDFGGKMTSSGRRIKQGLIYRGGELTDVWFDTNQAQKHIITLDVNTKNIFINDMNIRVDLDFRRTDSINGITDSPLNKDLGDDDEIKGTANVKFTRREAGSLDGFWNGNKQLLKDVFDTYKNATEEKAVYCHCWGGADRTGTAFFLLEGLLGVSYTECLMDYELTSFDNVHTRLRDRQTPPDMNGYTYNFPTLISAIKRSYSDWATRPFSEIVEEWMIDRVGYTKAEVEELRENLLEPEE